jgi:hypothetical protein
MTRAKNPFAVLGAAMLLGAGARGLGNKRSLAPTTPTIPRTYDVMPAPTRRKRRVRARVRRKVQKRLLMAKMRRAVHRRWKRKYTNFS